MTATHPRIATTQIPRLFAGAGRGGGSGFAVGGFVRVLGGTFPKTRTNDRGPAETEGNVAVSDERIQCQSTCKNKKSQPISTSRDTFRSEIENSGSCKPFFRRKLAHTGPDGSPPPSEAPRKTPLTPRRCRHRCILITQQARLHNVGMAGPTPFASYRWCPGYDTPLASVRGRCLVAADRRPRAGSALHW